MTKGKIGRNRLDITVKNIYDTLRRTKSMRATAEELNCSRGYIYQELKKVGTNPQSIIKEALSGKN